MQIIEKSIDELKPYEKNPRKNDKSVDDVIEKAMNNPDSKITIYRATPGNQINNGGLVFINPQKAEKWTKTAFGTPKKGFKVVKKVVSAKEIDWTGKNLEFMYKKKRKK